MTRFPTYPPDILSRADALLSEKYPDGIVDPRFVEIACEAMMMEQERCAKIAEHLNGWGSDGGSGGHAMHIAKAIRGTK